MVILLPPPPSLTPLDGPCTHIHTSTHPQKHDIQNADTHFVFLVHTLFLSLPLPLSSSRAFSIAHATHMHTPERAGRFSRLLTRSYLPPPFSVSGTCVCVCVCACVREKEREEERGGGKGENESVYVFTSESEQHMLGVHVCERGIVCACIRTRARVRALDRLPHSLTHYLTHSLVHARARARTHTHTHTNTQHCLHTRVDYLPHTRSRSHASTTTLTQNIYTYT
jgi:hypothetical protein